MATTTMDKTMETVAEDPVCVSRANAEAQYEEERTQVPDSLDERVRTASARYLELKGYDVLEMDACDGLIDLVCQDGDTLVFVEVQTCEDSFPEEHAEATRRRLFEMAALAYLAEHEYVDVPVRFDTVSVIPMAGNRAFLRHVVNALGAM